MPEARLMGSAVVGIEHFPLDENSLAGGFIQAAAGFAGTNVTRNSFTLFDPADGAESVLPVMFVVGK
jgi:hypothetical protein